MNRLLILNVNDDDAARYVISRVLLDAGYVVQESATGNDCLTFLEAHAEEVSAIILDVNLPDMSGFEVARAIREGDKLHRIPILHLSAEALNLEARITGLESGSDYYLASPVDKHELLAVVRTLVRQREHQFAMMEELRLSQELTARAQRLESVGHLAGGVAHDFNNLLMVIIGFAQLLEQKVLLGEEGRRLVVEIMNAAMKGAGLSQQLLAFSRKQRLTFEVIEVKDFFAKNEKLLQRVLPESIKSVFEVDTERRVRVDSSQLTQVLLNLILNAKDAMPRGGELTVSVRDAVSEDYQEFRLPNLDFVRISVCDTGTGIDPKDLPRIFEPFFTTKPVGEGTGLGLSVAYGIVKQSGGYIFAQSSPNLGTEFTVYLPSTEQQADIAGVPEHFALKTSATILLVEDEPTLREVVSETLESAGFQVLTAANGIEALEVAASQKSGPEILLTDVIMPELGGRELARRLRQHNPDLIPVFMSGYGQPNQDEGIFLQKPFSMQKLLEALSRVSGLPQKSQR